MVTDDSRGEYIEYILNSYGANALKMPDDIHKKEFLKKLREKSKEDSLVALALDGPVGPLHEPKKIAFSLAKYSNKPFVAIKVRHSKKLKLKIRVTTMEYLFLLQKYSFQQMFLEI